MKKMRCILCLAVLACFMCSGCKPIYQKLVEGTWKLDTYEYDGADGTTGWLLLHKDYRITFHSDGAFTETYLYIITVTGTWEIQRKPNGKIGEFQLQLIDNSGQRTYDIKKISQDMIDIYRTLSNGHTEELFLEPVSTN